MNNCIYKRRALYSRCFIWHRCLIPFDRQESVGLVNENHSLKNKGKSLQEYNLSKYHYIIYIQMHIVYIYIYLDTHFYISNSRKEFDKLSHRLTVFSPQSTQEKKFFSKKEKKKIFFVLSFKWKVKNQFFCKIFLIPYCITVLII